MTAFAEPACAFAPFSFAIEDEQPDDVASREALLDRAMGPGRRRKSSEKIRRGRMAADGLSLVARGGDGSLVGTVRLWHVYAGRSVEGSPVRALLLGPLAVDASAEGRGVGGALMREAVARAGRIGHGAVLLVGDPGYYARFGFSSASTGSLSMPGPFERHRLLALEIIPGWLGGAKGVVAPSGRHAGSTKQAA